ncbi:MAG: T9SS type A sorting domain-containing protein [Bacteroidales bacterium]|nr:T9SS type A sorting domain-containing protein [Bacteroidales bacterium]
MKTLQFKSKKMMNKILYSILCLIFTIFLNNVNAADITSKVVTGNWDVGSNWVGETVPVPGDNVTIAAGAVITINANIDINNLSIDGTLTIGNDATARSVIIQGTLGVSATGTFDVGDFSATHTINLQGAVTNNGTIDFKRNSSTKVANIVLNGTYTIGGSNTPQFNGVTFNSGTVTAGVALDIEGTVTIESGATFNDGGLTHTVAGNWTINGGSFSTSGTIIFDASLVQSVTNAATFYNLTINGGGIVSFSANVTVLNDFYMTNNTTLSTSATHQFNVHFTVDDGSSYNANDGYTYFYGSTVQTITIGDGNVEFDRVYFRYSGKKTIVGNFVANDWSYIYTDATVEGTGTHTFNNGLRINGTCDFSGTFYLNGGTFSDTDDDNFKLGTANIIVDGNSWVGTGDTMRVDSNLTISSGYLVLNDNAYLIDDATNQQHILKVTNGTSLYIRGTNNFPSGFGTYDFEQTSFVRYDANLAQTIRGGVTYGNLYTYRNIKTVDGSLDINGNLYVYTNAADGLDLTLNLLDYNHTLAGRIYNNGNSNITATGGNFTLDAEDAHQYIYDNGSGTYTFNDLTFTNTNPSDERTKRIYCDIIVNGDLTVTNASTNPSQRVNFDIDDHEITGGNNFNLGANVALRTSGLNNFKNSAESFTTQTLDAESTIRFDGNDQNLPDITYGNIALAGYGNKYATFGSIDVNGDVTREGGTPIFHSVPFFSDLNHTVAGNWELAQAYTKIEPSGGRRVTVKFDGADQIISASIFDHVVFENTGTKTIDGNLDLSGDLTINNGVTIDASNRYIYLEGNWYNESTGIFIQDDGRTTFDGDGSQTVGTQSLSSFYDLYVNKTINETLIASTDIIVDRHFRFTEDHGNFDLNGKTIYIGGNWYVYDGCTFYHNNGTLVFNGNTEDQLLRNYNENAEYYNIEFSGSGIKRFYDNDFDINNYVEIDHATVDAGGYELYVAGDWINDGGSFQHYDAVHFDGAKQSIDGCTFHDVIFTGTDTITLNGNITLNGWLRIDTSATLDVSTNNYNITVEEQWYNNEWNNDSTKTGEFICREGTVTFIGGYSNIYTGDSAGVKTNKQFYNLVINNTNNNIYTRLYPIHDGATKTEYNDIKIKNDFTVTNGIFYTYWNDIHVGGDFKNDGGYFNQNAYYNQYSTLYLNGSTGNTYEINAGDPHYFRKTEITNGATYRLTSDMTLSGNGTTELIIDNGILNLNHNTLTVNSNVGDITINSNGTLLLDSASVLRIYNGRQLLNNGGTISIIGNSSTPATVSSISGNYDFIQSSGTFNAQYFLIENTQNNGVDIQGGSLGTFEEGTFTGAIGTSCLTLTGIDLGGDITANNIIFNIGTTYNVSRTSGNGSITFENSSGTIAGESYDNDDTDPGTKILWTYPNGYFWTGGGDGSSWDDADNWDQVTFPDNTSNVYLDHTTVAGIYTVNIDGGITAEANRISIDAGATAISLVLNVGEFNVFDNLTVGANGTLTQTNANDTIRVGGNWSTTGTFNPGTGTVIFNPTSGTYSISNSNSFYDLIINAEGAEITLGSNIDIIDSIAIIGGTLSASNRSIYMEGNWSVNGGIFEPETGTVIFDKDGTPQTISGGTFNDLITRGTATKEVIANIEINDDITIEAGSVLDGKTSYIFVGDNWYNYAGNGGFTQTGTGTVVFNGLGGTNIGDNGATTTTTFNNLITQGTGTKYIYKDITINGDLTNQQGSNLYIGVTADPNVTVTGAGADNTFLMTGGNLYLRGTNNFPTGFENISLTDGLVDYYADTDQTIYPTTYYNLRVRRVTDGVQTTKTLTQDVNINNYLYIYDVDTKLDVAGYTITLGGPLYFPAGGRQIEWNGGTLIHNGDGWSIDADITGFNNFEKRGTGWITMNNNLNITGNVTFYDETYLNMRYYTMFCSGVGKEFSIGANSRIYSYVADTATAGGGKAFPTGFATYDIDPTNLTYIRGNEDQIILTSVTYGSLYLYDNSSRNVVLDGNLDVNGDFRMYYDNIVLVDDGFNLNLAGATIDIRNYSPTSTIYFDGTDQNIYAGGSYTTLLLNNIVFNGGSGTKNLNETIIDINGNLTINAGDTVYSNDDIKFYGSTWTNNGRFEHVADRVTFDGAGQTINPGSDNNFYGVLFDGSGTKTIANNGFDVYNGEFSIENGVTVDMGTLTHNIASTSISKIGTGDWTVNNTSLIFDRNGTQYIPSMTIQDLSVSTGRWKYMKGDIDVRDFTINAGAYFSTSEVSSDTFNIIVRGNWTNNGNFRSYYNTVKFESENTDAKTITSGGYNFYNVTFNQSYTNSRDYTIQDNTTVTEDLTIGNGATLKLNGNNLIIGNNDPNEPDYPDGEILTISSGATLDVDAGANLQFDCYDLFPRLDVYGTLKLVGEDGNYANLSRSAGNYSRIYIQVFSGGTIKAKYYHFQYLQDSGFEIFSGATIDPAYNFSEGIWSNISTATTGTHTYLSIYNDVTGLPDITNVTFNHSTTPVVGVHYNIYKDAGSAGTLTLNGNISGLMGSETYENDPSGLINWPPVTEVTWTGNVSVDWFIAGNWSPAGVPDNTTDVVVPLVTNNPLISLSGAECRSLNITDGILGIENGEDLSIIKNVLMGANSIFAIENSSTNVQIGKDLNIASNAVFGNGDATITFNASSGSSIIEQRNASFHNIVFNGAATFYLNGSSIDFEGDFTINAGTVTPNNDNYTYTIYGDFVNNGGTFVTSPNRGTFDFAGDAQSITNGTFSQANISGTNTKTTYGTTTFEYYYGNETRRALIIEPNVTLKAGAGSTIDIDGNILIEENGTFDDGGESHTFAGRYWTGTGNYTGTGTITFDGGTQTINDAKFNNLVLNNSNPTTNNWKYLNDSISVTGNVTVNCYGFNCYNYLINNTSGTGTFAMQNAAPGGTRIYISGADNFPSNFSSYTAEPLSYTFYNGTIDQTIRGGVQYGRLYLDNESAKTLGGNIDIEDRIYFYNCDVILDANDYKINIGGYWYNQYSGSFLCKQGEVVFDGNGEQRIYLGTSGTNDFYKLTIDKTVGTDYCRMYYGDINVKDEIWVKRGIFYVYTGYTLSVQGSLIASNDGTFYTSGDYLLNRTSGSADIQVNGSTLNNLTINSGATYTLQDDMMLNGTFIVESGTFNGNGNTVSLGNYADVANIYGTYYVGTGGTLELGNMCSFNVKNGGAFYLVGTSGEIASVSNRTGRYYLTIENGGTIHAKNYLFEYMYSPGIKINDGATINTTNNFSDGTFTNPYNGGTCLTIENSQSFVGEGNYIENVSFPVNNGYGTYNVTKSSATAGEIEFYAATGALAGEEYDNDPNNLIDWLGDITLTWTGTVSSDWDDADNWSADIGLPKEPTFDENVVIPSGVTNFPKLTNYDEKAKRLTINNGAFIEFNFPDKLDTGLVVAGDIDIDGTLTMADGLLYIQGNWDRSGTGIFSPGDGEVIMNGSGNKTIDNGNTNFNDLTINVTGTIQLSNNTFVNNDFTITSGTFDVTSTNFDLTVGGSFVNNGTYVSQNANLTFNASSGSKTFNPGTSSYNNIEFDAGTATYSLTGNNLYVNKNVNLTQGTFTLNKNTFYFGDGSGSDDLIIDNGATLEVDENAILEFGANSSIEVNNGGTFKAIGTDLDNVAFVTGTGSGRYSFDVNSGGTIHARYYEFQYMDSEGIHLLAGASVDGTNNFSEGTFIFGASDGRFLLLEHDIVANDTIRDVFFSQGPPYNVKRITGTNPVIFKDAYGVRSGHYFEDDTTAVTSATTGYIRWAYTSPLLTWTGNSTLNNNWDNADNWDNGEGGGGVPTSSTTVFIPNTGDSIPNINGTQADADAKNITIYSGGALIIGDDKNLTIAENLSGDGILTVSNGSNTTLKVGNKWDNIGTFNHGGNSTVEFNASNGNVNINTGGNPFYNITINSGNGTGTAIFKTSSAIDIDGDLTISKGTLEVTNSAHNLNIGGNWVNGGGIFQNGSSTVTIDGSGAQSVTSDSDEFYYLVIGGSGTKTFNDDITIDNRLTINSTLSPGANTINVRGEWINNGTFSYGTSTVKFIGTESQTLNGGTFYNLHINNTSALTSISLSAPVTIVNGGTLTLEDGIIGTTSSDIINLENGAIVSHTGGENCYISGPLKRTGSADFTFPIGKRPYYARLGISGMGSSSTFKAEYFPEAYSDLTVKPGLNSVSDVEYWNLSRLTGTAEPKVTYYWEDGTASGISDLAALVAASYITSDLAWENKGQGTVGGTVDVGWITSNDNYTSFGAGTFGFSYVDLTWTGAVDNSWNDPNNWDDGAILPSSTTNLIIPNVANSPSLDVDAEIFDLTIENSATLELGNNHTLTVLGSVNINAGAPGGTLNIPDGSTTNLNVKADWVNGGTFSCGNASTVTFNGDYDQDIAASIFYNLVIAGSQTKNLSGNITVNNALTISSTLNAQTNNISLKGDYSNSGTFTCGTGTFSLTGTAQQTITPSASETFNNLIINNTYGTSPQILLGGNVTITGALTLTDGIIGFSNSSNYISIDNAGSATAGSADSYVSGQMRKFGSTDFTFPIGKDDVWARLKVSDCGASGNFGAEYFYSPYSDITTMGTDMHHVSIIEYWNLNRHSGSGTPKATLHWEDTARSRIDDPTKLVLAHYLLGHWESEDNFDNHWTESGDFPGYLTSNNISSFSPVTFGVKDADKESNPLPIELLSFTAKVKENIVELNWITASEKNNDYFTIEKSLNGIDFEKITDVSGAGNSNNILTYQIADNNPDIGVNYYRLQQTDYDGETTISDIISVNIDDLMKLITDLPINVNVFPNPATNGNINISLKTIENEEIEISITDLMGKEYFNKSIYIESNQKMIITLDEHLNLRSGIYLIIVNSDKHYTKTKLVIQ